MNATSGPTGLVSDDASVPVNHRGRCAHAFHILGEAKETLQERGCWRLAREIEDEIARWQSEINPPTLFLPLGEGERSGEAVHGQDSKDAQVGPAWAAGSTDRGVAHALASGALDPADVRG